MKSNGQEQEQAAAAVGLAAATRRCSCRAASLSASISGRGHPFHLCTICPGGPTASSAERGARSPTCDSGRQPFAWLVSGSKHDLQSSGAGQKGAPGSKVSALWVRAAQLQGASLLRWHPRSNRATWKVTPLHSKQTPLTELFWPRSASQRQDPNAPGCATRRCHARAREGHAMPPRASRAGAAAPLLRSAGSQIRPLCSFDPLLCIPPPCIYIA